MSQTSRRRALSLFLAVLLAVLLAPAAWAASKPSVVVIGTGGTISGAGPDRTNPIDYRSGQLAIADMVGFLQPELGALANVSTVQFGNRGSGSYRIGEFHALTQAVEQQLRRADGVVVTTGTDTMEEFAYWLDLTVRSAKPVVLTGSMRPWTSISSDAQMNLFNAVRLAASERTRCFGTVVMLNDEFHAARDVTKTNTYRTDTFSSRRKGVLGHIDGPNIKVDRTPPRRELCSDRSRWRTPFDVDRLPAERLPRVEIVTAYQEAGGEAITGFADAGVRGIVTAGTGAGGISSAMSAARTAAVARGVTFVTTSRTGSGSVYGSATPGIVAGGDLMPQKARILLLLSLAFSSDPATVRDWAVRYGNPEFTTPPDDEDG
ncbi:MAG TPA: asparaginase [Solirubrobacteraceae bacterium]|nr:asparaginase [Solirubrobacteraceae bacterium]